MTFRPKLQPSARSQRARSILAATLSTGEKDRNVTLSTGALGVPITSKSAVTEHVMALASYLSPTTGAPMRLLTFQADTTDFPAGSVCRQFQEFQWLDLFVDRCEVLKPRKALKGWLFCLFCLCFVFERERERESNTQG